MVHDPRSSKHSLAFRLRPTAIFLIVLVLKWLLDSTLAEQPYSEGIFALIPDLFHFGLGISRLCVGLDAAGGYLASMVLLQLFLMVGFGDWQLLPALSACIHLHKHS